jgi:ABC-type lipoprotein export system ATPase subunit
MKELSTYYNATVIVATQNDDVAMICDEVIELNQGRAVS